MKKILIGIAAVIVLLIAAAFIVPALIPVETYKGQILAQIKAATGREARIDGGFKLSVLPSLEFVAGKFSLANAPGESPAQMVMLDNLTVRIALFPLIGGNVEIDSFVLEKPVIALSVDKNGKPNWQFDAKAAPVKPGAPAPTPGSAGGGGSPLSGLTLGDVRIVDGLVTYADARSGAKYAAEAINMKVSLPSMSSPMKADGSLVWNKEKITLGLNVANPNALMDGKQTAIDANIAANPVKLAFKGQVSNDKALNAGGNLDLDVSSVRKLAAWAGSPLDAPGSGFGPLKISGTVEVAGAKTAFKNAKFALDDIKGTGDLRFDGGGKRPNASARLALETVDINPYLPPESAGTGAAKPGTPSAPAPAAKSDWSDEPLDLKALRQADADLDLTVGGLVMRKIKIGKSHVAVALKDGKLTVDLTDMALYQGNGKAKVVADASQNVPAIALDFDLASFQANPFLSDAMDMDRLEGTANANLDVTGRGVSQRAIVSSLAGSGKVQFLNGAIRGINLAAMVRNVQSAFLDPNARKQEKTDFAELGGTYKIRNGILTNDDLELKSPLLRVTGKGTVDLPKRSVDYRVEPKVVASTEGQGGKGDLGGVMVPVLVQGPWDDLSYKPDLAGAIGNIAKDPTKALEGLKGAIPGAGATPGAGGAGGFKPPVVPTNPADAAKRLFGR